MCKVCLFGEKMMLVKLKRKVISNNLLLKNYAKQPKIDEKPYRK